MGAGSARPAGRGADRVLEGNPSEKGAVTLRLRFPANYNIPPHWHSMTERVTVLSGALHVGMGDKLDRQASQTLEPGGFVSLPANMHHFAWTATPTVVQINLEGPFDIFYVNPADNPQKPQTSSSAGGAWSMAAIQIEQLRSSVRGAIIQPGDEAYESARKVYNADDRQAPRAHRALRRCGGCDRRRGLCPHQPRADRDSRCSPELPVNLRNVQKAPPETEKSIVDGSPHRSGPARL